MAEQFQKYEIKDTCVDLGTKKRKGVENRMLLRRVSWYGSDPMWDLREWTPDGKPGKGITLTQEMYDRLEGWFTDRYRE